MALKFKELGKGNYGVQVLGLQHIGKHQVSIKIRGGDIAGSPVAFEVLDMPIFRRNYKNIQGPVVQFGSQGYELGQIQKAKGLCSTRKGEIVVLDQGNIAPAQEREGIRFGFGVPIAQQQSWRIQIFEEGGKFRSSFAVGKVDPYGRQQAQATGVAFDYRNNRIIVCFGNQVVAYSLEGKDLLTIAQQHHYQFMHVFVNSKGSIFVSTNQNYIYEYDSEGNLQDTFTNFVYGQKFWVLDNGNFVSAYNSGFVVLNSQGQQVAQYSEGNYGFTPLWCDSDGNVLGLGYLAKNGQYNGQPGIAVISKEGKFVSSFLANTKVSFLCMTPAGRVVAMPTNGQIKVC